MFDECLHIAELMACEQDVRSERTGVALAGGCNVLLSPVTTARICLLQALSPFGRCRTFDASAAGYGRGEGFAIVALRYIADFRP